MTRLTGLTCAIAFLLLLVNSQNERSMYGGNSLTSLRDYKNVSFDIFRQASSAGDIVAVIQRQGRSCR
jgi:hypothetical protein